MATNPRVKQRVKKLVKRLGLKPVIVLPQLKRFGSFFLPFGPIKFIHIASTPRYGNDVTHEVAHHHLETHLGKAIPKKTFIRLFGDFDKTYFGRWYFDPNWESLFTPKREFVSLYAQVHPAEDYCETFVAALRELELGRELDYGHPLLNKKVRAVKRWIQKTLP